MKRKNKINTDADYQNAIKRIDKMINEGFEKDEENRKEFLEIALAIQQYEKQYYPLRWPESIPEMIELKMFEMKIPNQKKLADKLKLAPDKLSQILNGKRPPDVEFLKKAHTILKIDPKFLLQHA